MRGWIARVEPPPDVFAVVMATGILAVAGAEHHYARIALILRLVSAVAAALLAAGFAIRVFTQPRRVMRLVTDPDVALRMFTVVAALGVLAACWPQRHLLGLCLDAVGLAGCALMVPLAARDVAAQRLRQLRERVHGAWLLPSVALHGLAATTADAASATGDQALVVAASTLWVVGLALYCVLVALLGWRLISGPLRPGQITPDSWIVMGALAIAALAGTHLALAAATKLSDPVLAVWARCASLGVWLGASACIPVLLYAQLWRIEHLTGSLHYATVWWAAVFPVGMYSAATAQMATLFQIPALTTVSLVFFWVAFTLWTLVTTGLLHTILASLRKRTRPGSTHRFSP